MPRVATTARLLLLALTATAGGFSASDAVTLPVWAARSMPVARRTIVAARWSIRWNEAETGGVDGSHGWDG